MIVSVLLCVCEASRLPEPWHCPVDGCTYSTTVKRARGTHLLRHHHLKFMGQRRAAVPLEGAELDERLEALRRRNR